MGTRTNEMTTTMITMATNETSRRSGRRGRAATALLLLLAALAAAPTPRAVAADEPAADAPVPADVQGRWDEYRTIRNELTRYYISTGQAIDRMRALAKEVSGTHLEPMILFHAAALLFSENRLDETDQICNDIKKRFPEHPLCKIELAPFKGNSQVDALLADSKRQRESRAELEVKMPVYELDKSPVAVFETTLGTIRIAFYSKAAPKHVENFIQRIENGEYVDTEVIFVNKRRNIFLGGEAGYIPSPDDPLISQELNTISNDRGTVAMRHFDAKRGDHALQFSINVGHPTLWDLRATVFGRVIEGMDVVDAISAVPIDERRFTPVQPIKIKSARLER